jgi:hypothetical protein
MLAQAGEGCWGLLSLAQAYVRKRLTKGDIAALLHFPSALHSDREGLRM